MRKRVSEHVINGCRVPEHTHLNAEAAGRQHRALAQRSRAAVADDDAAAAVAHDGALADLQQRADTRRHRARRRGMLGDVAHASCHGRAGRGEQAAVAVVHDFALGEGARGLRVGDEDTEAVRVFLHSATMRAVLAATIGVLCVTTESQRGL